MAVAWSQYQEDAAEFFRSLGLEAATNVTLTGVHTQHDVDVMVKSRQAGFEVTWIVECKLWNTRVTKNHVLALRTIVSDLGADRGILLAENGFQSGALEAAALTNVHVSSLADVRRTSQSEVFAMRLSDIYDRIDLAKLRYWEIPKATRIKYALRTDVGDDGYSGTHVITFVEEMLRKGFRGSYPFAVDHFFQVVTTGIPPVIGSAHELVALLESLVTELERRLRVAEAAIAAEP